MPPFTLDYDDVVDDLPASFDDDLLTKPACHRQWRWDQQHWLAGYIPPDDREQWRRQLDYYVKLHELADESLGKVLGALERSGAWDDTVDRLHVRPRRHVRQPRPPVEGPVRLRRDHAGALLHQAGRRRRCASAGTAASRCRRTSTWPARSAASPAPIPIPGCRASTSARSSPTRPPRCATTCCSPTPPPTRRTSAPHAGRSAACSTAATSTPATTAWAAASPTTTSPACPPRCSTAPTPPSRTRSTSGTTSRRTRTSWSTSPWTTAAAPSCASATPTSSISRPRSSSPPAI